MATKKRKLIFKKPKLRPGFFEFLKHIGLELVIFWASLALIVFVLVIIFRPLIEQWMVNVFIRTQQSELKEEASVESPISPISRVPLQGSFTELFSGVGWRNPENSNVYQDFKTLTISFPPAYDWDEVDRLSDVFAELYVLAAKGNEREVFFVTSAGEVGFFRRDEEVNAINLVSFVNPESLTGSVAVDYDGGSDRWFVSVLREDGADMFEFRVGDKLFSESSYKLSFSNPNNVPPRLTCIDARCLLQVGGRVFTVSKSFGSWTSKILELPDSIYSVGIGKTDSTFIMGLVNEKIGTYSGKLYGVSDGNLILLDGTENLFSSSYPGEIYFGFNNESNEILAVYVAFEGQAQKFKIQNSKFKILEDYSRFFTTRVMNEGGVLPEIFYKSGAWWIGSAASSPLPKFLRIRGGVGNDLTPNLISTPFFQLVPGFDSNVLYGITGDGSSSRVFRYRDAGFERTRKLVWESLRLNAWDGEIVRGRLTHADDGEDDGSIKYFFSNSGGKKWIEVELNKFVEFNKRGGDFRWKAEVFPSKDRFQSPWISQVRVEYFIIRQ
ncbi:MAG: hypothetical protein KJI72_01585 [Patescibacteria group bacterium]|nr:hypothetical protein [Patescibacteria group bacterium]